MPQLHATCALLVQAGVPSDREVLGEVPVCCLVCMADGL